MSGLGGAARRVLTPAFRRWAYGVAVALVGVAVFAGWIPPAAATVAAPLLMALLYVNDAGDPREHSTSGGDTAPDPEEVTEL